MSRSLTLYSFADVDRSGKVRWTAFELDYDIEEHRLGLGEHRGEDYLALNPYGQIPSIEIDDEVWIDSTAICIRLAERYPEAGLIPAAAAARGEFWRWVHLASSTLELPVVNYYLSNRGVMDERWNELVAKDLHMRINTVAGELPADGYLCGAFSLADICAAYVLRIAVQAELLSYEGNLAAYLDRLSARPAAIQARFFDSIKGG